MWTVRLKNKTIIVYGLKKGKKKNRIYVREEDFEISHVEREVGETSIYSARKLPEIVFKQIIGIFKLKRKLSRKQ